MSNVQQVKSSSPTEELTVLQRLEAMNPQDRGSLLEDLENSTEQIDDYILPEIDLLEDYVIENRESLLKEALEQTEEDYVDHFVERFTNSELTNDLKAWKNKKITSEKFVENHKVDLGYILEENLNMIAYGQFKDLVESVIVK